MTFFPDWPTLAPEPPGTDRWGPEAALRLLLSEQADVLFLLSATTCEGQPVLALYVNCNDLFFWAYADCEEIPPVGGKNDGPFWQLYDLVREHGPRGALLWCCLQRNMQPQRPIRERWKADGFWPVELDACVEPAPS